MTFRTKTTEGQQTVEAAGVYTEKWETLNWQLKSINDQ